jgi:hypothetical protein
MLERENKFYMEHQVEFKEKYNDKWLVIVGDSLWGVYDKVSDAGKAALQNFEPGEFLIHSPADDGTVIELGPIVSVTKPGVSEENDDSAMIITKGEMVSIQYAY